jgi:hypothetical protein
MVAIDVVESDFIVDSFIQKLYASGCGLVA